jgi:hypothetical protein
VIKIEVTGNSIPEVADKLIAIGTSLRNTAANDADNAAREAMQAKRKTPTKVDPVMPELRGATGNEGKAPSEVASSGPTEASPTAPSGTEPETPTTGEPEAPAAPEIDPTYLRDLVLKVVDKRGKPFMAEILERFGIAKASQVAPEHAPELVATMLEALA